MFGTADGWLISLNAKTGKLSPGFGNEGMVNLRAGVTDKFSDNYYGMSSPPQWMLSADTNAVPITYQGKNGKQYVAIVAQRLHAFALP